MFVFLLSYVMFWVMRGQARMSLLLPHDQSRIEANTADTGGWGVGVGQPADQRRITQQQGCHAEMISALPALLKLKFLL